MVASSIWLIRPSQAIMPSGKSVLVFATTVKEGSTVKGVVSKQGSLKLSPAWAFGKSTISSLVTVVAALKITTSSLPEAAFSLLPKFCSPLYFNSVLSTSMALKWMVLLFPSSHQGIRGREIPITEQTARISSSYRLLSFPSIILSIWLDRSFGSGIL